MQRTSDEVNDIDTLKKIQFFAYPAIPVFSALPLAILRDRVTALFGSHPVLVSALAACIVLLVALWISATTHEFQLWQRYIHYVFIRQQVYAAMFGLAFVLGTLLVFAVAFNVVVFTAFLSSYLLFNYWTQWVTNEHFERALEVTLKSESLSASHRKILMILRHYWLARPQLARIATMMFVSLVAFALAFRGMTVDSMSANFTAAAYLLEIITIIVGEAVIYRWRHIRDSRLQPIIDSEKH